jgi:hypothetical protein
VIMRNVWIKLIASAVLSVNYLLVLWLILHPHTSEEYRDHYLNRKSDCWYSASTKPSPLPADTIDLSAIPDREACRFLRYGWTSGGNRGAEAVLPTLTLRVPVKPGVSAIQLDFNQPSTHTEEADISLVGGRKAAAVHLGPQRQAEVTIPVDANAAAGNNWLFQIEADDKRSYTGNPLGAPSVRHIALKTIRYVRQDVNDSTKRQAGAPSVPPAPP